MGLLDGGLMGLGDQLADDLGKPKEAAEAETYEKPFSPSTFDEFGGPVRAGREVEVARYRAPAGTEVRWGSGRAKNSDNQGYAWAQPRNEEDEPITGLWIFKWENSTGRRERVINEIQAEDIDTEDRYNRDRQKPFPEARDKPKAEQDQFLTVTFVAEEDGEIDADNTSCRFPATEYDVA